MSNFPNPGGGSIPADVLTETEFPTFFNPQQVEYTGSYRIDSLDKLKATALNA